jgi:predicted nucleic acid-binding protein
VAREAASERVLTWLAEKSSFDLAISEWVITEFSAALSVKLRQGQITKDVQRAALSAFKDACRDSLTLLQIETHHFRAAARLADQHETGLRAGDALHLALCLEEVAILATLDKRLAASGTQIGVQTLLV